VTVHVPRRAYVDSLSGVPTIRPFEALACGIPLISARWHRAGDLFTPGADFLVARDGAEMTAHLQRLIDDPERRRQLAARGLQTVRARHTCAHRVDELLAICDQIPSAQMETL
jgi:spore maturation protein CgeB